VTGPRLGRAARLESRGDAQWWRAPALDVLPDVVHGVTHASLGNFSLSTATDASAVHARRRELLHAAGLSFARVVAPRLFHSADVAIVDRGEVPAGTFDAFVTLDPATVLAVTVADCVPVFFVDVGTGAFGVAHAGWRGLAGGIVRRTVRAMRDELGTHPADLLVACGPSIRGPHYEVGPEVAAAFPEEFAVPSGADGRAFLDLPSCALAQAAAERIPKDNLVDFALCTFERPGALFSHRRGDRDRHWAFIGRA
jgi:YfiH family protein